MRKSSRYLLILLISVWACFLSVGCASGNKQQVLPETPAQMALDAHNAYDLIMSGLTEARQLHLIPDDQKAQIENVRSKVYEQIKALDDAAITNNTTTAVSAMNEFRMQIDGLRKWLVVVKGQTPPKTLK
jgi:uncharacterized protein (DUF849 family)